VTVHARHGAVTDIGRVRRGNEDRYLVDPSLGLYAVADGMGGHRAGEVASETALDALHEAVGDGGDIETAMTLANEAVFEKASDDDELRGMGTTLTAVTLRDDKLEVGHVGDSRAYLRRDGSLQQLTDDHSLVAELVAAGEISEDEAEVDPRRSMITRALGIEPGVEVDVVPIAVQAGDRLVLCSDGLTGMIRDDALAEILEQESDPKDAAKRLVDRANEAGGIDNVTVVVVDIVDGPAPDDGELVERGPQPGESSGGPLRRTMRRLRLRRKADPSGE